jgi:hypothetical protein
VKYYSDLFLVFYQGGRQLSFNSKIELVFVGFLLAELTKKTILTPQLPELGEWGDGRLLFRRGKKKIRKLARPNFVGQN